MNTEWRKASGQCEAAHDPDQAAQIDRPVAEAWAALNGNPVGCDLSPLQGLVAAHGPDSANFLQGQLTCDVRQVTPEHSLLGAYCSPKGRVLACGRLFQRQDAYFLVLPAALIEPTLARLAKYLLRAKTRLEDARAELTSLGLAGADAESWLAASLSSAIPHLPANGVLTVDDVTVIRLPGPTPRFELHGSAQGLTTLWRNSAEVITPVDTEVWRLLAILAGIPAVYPATVDAFVPQMLNLHLLDGISFQKGCYTGQEIVVRTQHLGKLKRRMYLARVDSPTPPQPGDLLFSPEAGPSQNAGQIADAARYPAGGYAVLAVALIDCAERGTLQLGDASGPTLCLASLPYAFGKAD